MTNKQVYETLEMKSDRFIDYLRTYDGLRAMFMTRIVMGMSERDAIKLVFAAWLSSETTPENETETETENTEWEN